MEHISNISGLFIENLNSLYGTEQKQFEILKKLKEAVKSEEINFLIKEEEDIKVNQINRLNEVFGLIGIPPKHKENFAASEIIRHGLYNVKHARNASVSDFEIINALHSIIRYSIANYSTALTYARQIGEEEIVQLLDVNMEEEKLAIEKLSSISMEHFHKGIVDPQHN